MILLPKTPAVRTRFAPSPSGDLHLGSVAAALVSWCRGGTRVLRIEDLDAPRVVPGASVRQMEDLLWLGLHWDEGPECSAGIGAPYTQSAASHVYAEAVASLQARGLVYPCDCSRKEIASLASAPHEGEEIPYGGTCSELDANRAMRRPPAWRLRVPHEVEEHFLDLRLGPQRARVAHAAGDFVLRRGDGTFTYQLACAIDDGRAQITDVVRGEDLLESTARQRLLQRMLGLAVPQNYLHIPTIVGADGTRLAKRHGAPSVRALRDAGRSPESVVGLVAYLLGLQQHPEAAAASAFMGLIPTKNMAHAYLDSTQRD